MTNYEMIEMLREKANISYEEAKDALERTNWNLLDALVLLAKEGKVVEGEADSGESTRVEEKQPEQKGNGAEELRNAFKWLGEKACWLLKVGNTNSFAVSYGGREKFALPVTVCVILLICGNWSLLLALVIAMLCGVRYSFHGAELGKPAVNNVLDRAADALENLKKKFRSAPSKVSNTSSAETKPADDDIYGQDKDENGAE